jgi:hypothetical protein
VPTSVLPVATRNTFLVQVRADGVSTLENLATRERVLIEELAGVGEQINRWLARAADQPSADSGRALVKRRVSGR